jgi:hypothetical protein
MTTEFRIDRPGVYRRRDGTEVCLWPIFSTGNAMLQWAEIQSDLPDLHGSNGRCSWERLWPKDIVTYVSPLPTEILARMREALALAEGDEPQSPTVEQRLRHKCSACGEWPNELRVNDSEALAMRKELREKLTALFRQAGKP